MLKFIVGVLFISLTFGALSYAAAPVDSADAMEWVNKSKENKHKDEQKYVKSRYKKQIKHIKKIEKLEAIKSEQERNLKNYERTLINKKQKLETLGSEETKGENK